MVDKPSVLSDAPVIEVALGVAFEPIAELGAVALARLASDWQSDYPTMREVPGRPSDHLEPGVSFEFGTGAPPSRVWLLSSDENDLVQIQNDTLIINWRRIRPEDAYPGHNALIEKFEGLWLDFLGKVNRRKSIRPKLVEWTYVDRLETAALSEGGLTFIDWKRGSQLPGVHRGFNFQVVRELRASGKREGFLTITGNLAKAPTTGSFYAVNISTKLTAPPQQTAISARLQQAHDYSYQAFTTVFKPELQGGQSE